MFVVFLILPYICIIIYVFPIKSVWLSTLFGYKLKGIIELFDRPCLYTMLSKLSRRHASCFSYNFHIIQTGVLVCKPTLVYFNRTSFVMSTSKNVLPNSPGSKYFWQIFTITLSQRNTQSRVRISERYAAVSLRNTKCLLSTK